MTTTRTIVVADIHCASCETALRAGLGRISGVHRVRPEADTNTVTITYDEQQLTDSALHTALTDLGYPPTSTLGTTGVQANPTDTGWNHSGVMTAGRRWAARGAALAALVLMFSAGAWLYVRAGAHLTGRSTALPAAALLGLAAVAGAASFFSPCSIAITPSFLGYLMGATGTGPGHRRRIAVAGAVVALGIVSFYAVAGALVGWLGAIVYNYLIYLIAVVAVVFLALGFLVLSGRDAGLTRLAARLPTTSAYQHALATGDNGPRRLFGFGLAYGAASHTCTLPIFLGIVAAPLTTGAFALAAATTLTYGTATALLLMVMAVLGEGVLSGTSRRALGQRLSLATGVLFVATGAYLTYYFLTNYGGLL